MAAHAFNSNTVENRDMSDTRACCPLAEPQK